MTQHTPYLENIAKLPLYMVPSILRNALGLIVENDAIKLRDYYDHAGGILSFGNALWSYGKLGFLLYSVWLPRLIWRIDSIFSIRAGLRQLVYFGLLPIFTVQLFYGIQGLLKVIGILLLFTL